MPRCVYCYHIAPTLSPEVVENLLIRAVQMIEHLHGEPAARLDARYHCDPDHHRCVIDASSAIGVELNRLFAGTLTRECGPDGFTVERHFEARPSVVATGA